MNVAAVIAASGVIVEFPDAFICATDVRRPALTSKRSSHVS